MTPKEYYNISQIWFIGGAILVLVLNIALTFQLCLLSSKLSALDAKVSAEEKK